MNKVLKSVLTSALVLGFMPVAFSAEEAVVEKEDIYTGVKVGTVPMKNKDDVIRHLEDRYTSVSKFTDRINDEFEEMGQKEAFKNYADNYFGSAAWLASELADALEVQGKDVSDLRDLEKELREAYNVNRYDEDGRPLDQDEDHIQLQVETFAKVPALLERAREVIEELKA